VTSAKVVETHISTVLFLGERVYKLRKPVHFDFVDFRDRAARLADCRREVELNRRLAPDVYLGVADVVLEGKPVDHMVVMRRMPDERRLSTLIGHEDGGFWVRRIAAVLADFHARAARSPTIDEAATATALRAGWEDNFAATGPFVGRVLDADAEEELRVLVRRWLDGREPLLRERIEAGRVCDGHGDLQAEDVFCLDDGVRILDCIEFSDRLRHGDVVADVAFLAMDLERLGHPEAADQFVACYQEFSGDRFPASLLHHSCASRAYVRAKVACLRAAQGTSEAVSHAHRVHALALDRLRRARVRMVLIGGLPGTGKSTLAAAVGARRTWVVLRSDEIRAEGSDRPEDAPPAGPSAYLGGRYAIEATEATYRELLRRAERALERGESVVLDASWTSAAQRSAARAIAERTASDLIEVQCSAAPDVADRRLSRRLSAGSDPSEATPSVRAAMRQAMDPWLGTVEIDTTTTNPETALVRALSAVGE
jgi:aminoglycoside phosphotransferase family enzyme/predicted kinase